MTVNEDVVSWKEENILKNKVFYHASNISGLSQLEPLSTLHGSNNKVCYFTPNKIYALFYLRDIDINHVTCNVSENGMVIYHEQFPHQLEVLYSGRNGTIYHCSSTDIEEGHTKGVWIATVPVEVKFEEYVGNVYENILSAERLGNVRVIRYDTLSDVKKSEIMEVMKNYILKRCLLDSDSAKATFMRTYFPDSWRSAEEDNNEP